jgi:hypothetical protein
VIIRVIETSAIKVAVKDRGESEVMVLEMDGAVGRHGAVEDRREEKAIRGTAPG